ncbi:DUF3500 domain-containing protein [Pontivivens ytuae]|uniref:DUF3500 domain-containing protein n=1 Tax=Pontivivens ytuae TaxID=2789856 RepID=A0A7S9LUU8_9RHOB|nr:DUF3500 domain-containing protein [Pontivivens ytuae]QPH55405.1 DUF3500 domain-containing protein [Pontivivens ytuae]
MSRFPTSPLNRREALALTAGGAALAALPAAIRPAQAQAATPGALMVERAQRVLGLLDEPQVESVRFGFDSATRRAWDYMIGSAVPTGLPLEQMTAEQKDAAMDLLATALSPSGLVMAERIMLQQDILRDEWGKGSPTRNSERFSLTVYGEPGDGPWAWRWEGHHLTLSLTLVGDRVVSVTPNAFASEPNTVPSGPHAGMVVLEEEEMLGRQLFADLAQPNRDRALLREASFGNVLTTAGNERRFGNDRAGVPLADLPQAQADLAVRLIEVYAVDPLTTALAEEQSARIREGDLMATRFGWAGADLDGPSIYYRLHGDTFVIEFATVRNQPQHLHTIRHDPERNLGNHAV